MQWYDAYKMWPQLNSGPLMIKGWVILHVKPEFQPPNHEKWNYISLNYIALIDGLDIYDEDEGEFTIPGAIFTTIDEYCCNTNDKCEKHYWNIGLHAHNIFDFVEETKESIKGSHGQVTEWAMLNEMEIK